MPGIYEKLVRFVSNLMATTRLQKVLAVCRGLVATPICTRAFLFLFFFNIKICYSDRSTDLPAGMTFTVMPVSAEDTRFCYTVLDGITILGATCCSKLGKQNGIRYTCILLLILNRGRH